MNKNMKILVEALKSDKFKQGKGSLAKRENKSYKYCLFGVACNLAIKNGVRLRKERSGDYIFYNDSNAIPPIEVLNWLGINHNEAKHLVGLNDDGISFRKLAKYIESRYK